ncbi:PEP-CTERM sorting domain-containing protein [Methylocaldum sp. MU1018]
MLRQISTVVRAGLLSVVLAPVAAQAVPLSSLDPANAADTQTFRAITNNNPPLTQALEDQLFVDIYDRNGDANLADNQVLFVFRNVGPIASSIAGIYFDDDADHIISSVNGLIDADETTAGYTGDPNVDFSVGGTPAQLPAGNTVGFISTWRMTADDPAPQNGINPGEIFGVMFNLAGGFTLADLLQAKLAGDFRIGLHVISIGGSGGGSDSYVNVVPEPGIVWLLASGLMGLGFANRRRAECFGHA